MSACCIDSLMVSVLVWDSGIMHCGTVSACQSAATLRLLVSANVSSASGRPLLALLLLAVEMFAVCVCVC